MPCSHTQLLNKGILFLQALCPQKPKKEEIEIVQKEKAYKLQTAEEARRRRNPSGGGGGGGNILLTNPQIKNNI
jgi:hypothetical protein